MKKIISIIIPVYNSINYMDRCLKCLEEQTSNQFEAIFIDDCSTDNSYEELSKKLKDAKYSYQLLQNEKNMGPGFTRNIGLKNANYDYITFIDSDDYVSNNFVSEIIDCISKCHNSDCIIFDYYVDNNGYCKPSNTLFSIGEGILTTNEALALTTGSTWCKVYKKKNILDNKIYFPNFMRGEDLTFNKLALSKCKKNYYLKRNLYYYVNNSNSIMNSNSTINISNYEEIYRILNDSIYSKYEKEFEFIFVKNILCPVIKEMIILDKTNSEILNQYNKLVINHKNWNRNCYIKYLPISFRIILYLIYTKRINILRFLYKAR